jgi:hypothetical protein
VGFLVTSQEEVEVLKVDLAKARDTEASSIE